MKPEISKISQISPAQSIVCILGSDHVPEWLKLTKQETGFAKNQLRTKEEYIFINSYSRCIYLIRLKNEIVQYKVREELRRTSYNLRKLIKENNHSELVITSEKAYNGAIEDFTEGLILSLYSFDKYKTKPGKDDKKCYLSRILLYGDIADTEIRWLIDLTDAVYFTRNLIKEPVNQLNATSLAAEA